MPLSPDSVGVQGVPIRRSWSSTDAMLYALGVGAGVDDLAFTTENSNRVKQRVLPTFAVIIGGGGIPLREIGTFDPTRLFHGAQAIELLGEIPPSGEVETIGRISALWDKRHSAVVEAETESRDQATGDLLVRGRWTLFVRGEGGWGGERGPSQKLRMPDREPDHRVDYQTSENQALWYRLSGDRNPLHSDPWFAGRAGFDRPILHGLCTYGFAGRALLSCLCGNDPSCFRTMSGRFTKPVFPGDLLTVSIWKNGREACFQTSNQHGETVLDQGLCTVD